MQKEQYPCQSAPGMGIAQICRMVIDSAGSANDEERLQEAAKNVEQRNVTFMTWNLPHLGRFVRDAGGIPGHGNPRSKWDAGCRFDHSNPEHR